MTRGRKSEGAVPKRFEEILERLDVLVEKLESGELSLEASLEAYEQGTQLARAGTERLDEAERRLEILSGEKIEGEPSSGGGTG